MDWSSSALQCVRNENVHQQLLRLHCMGTSSLDIDYNKIELISMHRLHLVSRVS